MGKHVRETNEVRDWCGNAWHIWDAEVCTECGRMWGTEARVGSPVAADVAVVAGEWGSEPFTVSGGRYAA